MSKENDENKGAPAPDPFKAMAQNNIKFSMFGDDNLNDMENKNDNKNEIKKDKKFGIQGIISDKYMKKL